MLRTAVAKRDKMQLKGEVGVGFTVQGYGPPVEGKAWWQES